MILGLYFLFLALAIVLIIFGFASGISMFNIVGTIMLFLLGFTLLGEGVHYKVGENITSSIDANNVTTQEVVDVYETYDDAASNRFGWILLLLGGLGFLYSLYDI